MAQKPTLRAKGLFTYPNLLSELPDGALVEANNVIIDRDSVIEPRRGFAQYGNEFGIGTDRAKQLLEYKDRLLVHYNDTLLYNSVAHDNSNNGIFFAFDGSYTETETGRRIRYVESNKNLFFTTNDGIKKISAKTSSDFVTAPGFIVDAGGIKALDLNGTLDPALGGFLPPNSKVAYRLTWSYKDANDNLIEGVPSSRLVITNFNISPANVELSFSIPQGIDDRYFYRIYRTGVFTTSGSLSLDDIDPGDEMNLVLEDYPTSVELTAGVVNVEDISAETFRQNGLLLYTNPTSGEGIGQSNEPPPLAKDIDMYQSTVFYANTQTRAKTQISLLGVSDLISNTSAVIVTPSVGLARTYTFQGQKEITNISFAGYTGTIPTAINGKYFLQNSSSNIRKYYVWYDTTLTTQTVSFINYIGAIPADLDTKYFILNTENDRKYYVWFDATGSSIDPGTTEASLANLLSIKVDISTGITTKAQLAQATYNAVNTNNIYNDFILNYTLTNQFFTIQSSSFDETTAVIENLQKGFSLTITTPANSDPANDLVTNTDVVGRIAIRVDVSKGVTTKAQLADATAAAIESQNTALDFNVSYTTSDEFLVVETSNFGYTDNTIDSTINPIGNGILFTLVQDGTGEDTATNKVLLSNAATPSLQIDESARSLVKVINADTQGSVYAYYVSGPNDLPGQILLEVRDIGTASFNITADSGATGEKFNPSLPPATGAASVEGLPETKPNRIYFSKTQQPEAVPLLNFIDVGPEDKAISRILALRESLFILKQDGVYRLTGFSGSFSVDAFDKSTQIIAPDSAVVLNNQIYCLTNQGVAAISDTGISIISRPIENIIDLITSSNYDFEYTSFGTSYETDRAYLLAIVSNTADTVATQILRYNTFTQAWTRWAISKTCAHVLKYDDKLYFGPADENFVERERKFFKRTDYADRQFEISIVQNGVNNNIVTLSTSQLQTVGDALVQEQKLTIGEFNQMLKKLDLDQFVSFTDYFTTLQALPGVNLRTSINNLALKLDLDPGIDDSNYFASLGGGTTFTDLQNDFNIIVNKLNLDIGVFASNFPLSLGTKSLESLITLVTQNNPKVTIQSTLGFIEGPITLYKGINAKVIYGPETFGDPSILKQVREATMMFENNTFTKAEIGYATDLSPGFIFIPFTQNGKGDWGSFVWGDQNWGGGFSGIPVRTYIPQGKQRCRYIQTQFKHSSAREKWAIFGISYTMNQTSERGYRG